MITKSLTDALAAARDAYIEGLAGKYPSACIVLANEVEILTAKLEECRKTRVLDLVSSYSLISPRGKMTREKARTHVRACRHFHNRRKWAVQLVIGCQTFTLDCGDGPLTKREAGWWMEQLTTALTHLSCKAESHEEADSDGQIYECDYCGETRIVPPAPP